MFISQKQIENFNYQYDPNSKREETIYNNYSVRIIDPEGMKENLEKVGNEHERLNSLLISKINMKLSMEISVLVLTTLLSIGGLLGRNNFLLNFIF